MNWDQTPLYLRAFDVAQWLEERQIKWRSAAAAPIGNEASQLVRELLVGLSLALTFPAGRIGKLTDCHELVIRLHMNIGQAAEHRLLNARQLRHVTSELEEISRMILAWRQSCANGNRDGAATTVAMDDDAGASSSTWLRSA